MNIRVQQTNLFPRTKEPEKTQTVKKDEDMRTLLRDINRSQSLGQGSAYAYTNRLFEQSEQYVNALRDARIKKSKTLTELKKLRYNFKAISSQILRSKTSTAAKAAVGKARAEVVRLKRLRQSGQYDEEELQYAIAHAMAMERVAKKKAKHLQEEEMISVKEVNEDSAQVSPDRTVDAMDDVVMEQGEEDVSEAFDVGELLDLMDVSEFQSEMGNLMMSLLENMDWMEMMSDTLSELSESYETEMSPEDYKMLKIKHRNKEMRQMVEADARYLKAVFDKLQSEQSQGASGCPVIGGISNMPAGGVSVSTAAEVASLPTVSSGTVDVMV